MAEISSYVNYLPPVLWFRDNDPSQFLGRMLRIFEKILTGIPIDARAVRARAPFVNATNDRIQLTDIADAASFRARDIITIEGTAEREQIDRIVGADIFLAANLTAAHVGGIVRIADLETGQSSFRVDDGTGLGTGIIIKITQGMVSETAIVAQLSDDFITLRTGLTQKYAMADTDVPVRIQDGLPIIHSDPTDAQVVRANAPFVNATNDKIQLANVTDALSFREGDIVTIEGTAEREQIDRIVGADIFLAANLTGAYAGGIVRIADLEPTQPSFRVDDGTGLGAGIVIKITQGMVSETATVAQLSDDFITLRTGLTQKYAMAATDVPVRIHGYHQHVSFEEAIDDLHQILNPWRTCPDFLPWLASWVGLTLQKDWSEYQQRKLISQMVSVYQQRGLKKGLYTYLDIYAVTKAKPRIAIDDGEAVFRATFLEDGTARLHAIAHSNTVSLPANKVKVTVLLHPSAIAVDSKNNYIVADEGHIAPPVSQQPKLWKMSSTGEVDYAPGPPIPLPAPIHSGSPLEKPTAVVVDSLDRYSVVDCGTITSGTSLDSAIYRFAPSNSGYNISTVIDQTVTLQRPVTLPAVHPVDMILDGDKNFVVLDRGAHAPGDPPAGAAIPKIVVVSEGPLDVTSHQLEKVVEPTAIVMDSMGRFIVADAKDQYSADPVELVRVDPETGWSEEPLLAAPPPADPNPLVFPTGLVFENPDSLLVCDTGVRWGYDTMDPEGSDPAYRYLAEPAAIYRVDLSQTPPTITRVTYERKLVYPTKMAIDRNGKLIITDRGESLRSLPQRNWRAGSNEFGVVVHFSRQRPTNFEARNRIRRGIVNVVEEQKPGHTSWWMDF